MLHSTEECCELMSHNVTCSGHHHTGYGVRYTGSSSKQRQSHNGIRDEKGLTCVNISTDRIRFPCLPWLIDWYAHPNFQDYRGQYVVWTGTFTFNHLSDALIQSYYVKVTFNLEVFVLQSVKCICLVQFSGVSWEWGCCASRSEQIAPPPWNSRAELCLQGVGTRTTRLRRSLVLNRVVRVRRSNLSWAGF